MTQNIILVGGPDTGKTNYLARLVAHLRDGDGALAAKRLPDDMRYIEDALEHLMKGEFAPRSHNTSDGLSGEISIEIRNKFDGREAHLLVPDVSGETWDEVAKSAEISQEWLDRVQAATGALLFVRILSDLNVSPLDWLTAPEMLALVGEGDERQFALWLSSRTGIGRSLPETVLSMLSSAPAGSPLSSCGQQLMQASRARSWDTLPQPEMVETISARLNKAHRPILSLFVQCWCQHYAISNPDCTRQTFEWLPNFDAKAELVERPLCLHDRPVARSAALRFSRFRP